MKKFMKNTMTASFGRQVNDAPIPANQNLELIDDGAGANLAAS